MKAAHTRVTDEVVAEGHVFYAAVGLARLVDVEVRHRLQVLGGGGAH